MRKTLLVVAAVFCFAAAYRFASHGIPARDHMCIGLACAAVAVGGFLLWIAFVKKCRVRDGASG